MKVSRFLLGLGSNVYCVLKSGNTKQLDNVAAGLLNATATVAKQIETVNTKKADTELLKINEKSMSALDRLSQIAGMEIRKADPKTAEDIRKASELAINKVLEFNKGASDAIEYGRKTSTSSVSKILQSNKNAANDAARTSSVLNAIKLTQGQSQESAADAIYKQVYGNEKVPTMELIERKAAINEALKPYTKNGKVDSSKINQIKHFSLLTPNF